MGTVGYYCLVAPNYFKTVTENVPLETVRNICLFVFLKTRKPKIFDYVLSYCSVYKLYCLKKKLTRRKSLVASGYTYMEETLRNEI